MSDVSISNNVTPAIRNKWTTFHFEQPWFVLSAARRYDLLMSDDHVISHFYGFEVDQSNGMTFAIPDGCVDIVFDCNEAEPTAKVCGSPLEARAADLKPGHRYFGVRFSQGILPDFVDASAKEIVNHELDLLDLVPGAKRIFAEIVEQSVFQNQVDLFREFHAGQAPRLSSRLTAEVVRFICERRGDIRIKELETLTGYTSRTIQRQFQCDMGMSPKVFSRIVRCQSAVQDISRKENVVSSELACDLGFSDQSHFLREFKKFVSTTPLDYQRKVRQNAYLQRICLS